MFERQGGSWVESAVLIGSFTAKFDEFGAAVFIDGDTIAVGAPDHDAAGINTGAVHVFERQGGSWVETAVLTSSTPSALAWYATALSVSGDTIFVGAYQSSDAAASAGAVHVYEKQAGVWGETAVLTASDAAAGDLFGVTVSVSGDTAVVGAIADDDAGDHSGSAYVFERQGGAWVETAKLTASDAAAFDWFGRAVIEGDTIVVSAYLDDEAEPDSGSFYLFERQGGGWVETAKLTSSQTSGGDQFGWSLALSGDWLVLGAPSADAAGAGSGAAHVFSLSGVSGEPLSACPGQVSEYSGGSQAFALAAGASLAGHTYLLLGSASGTAPGIPLGAWTLPLAAPDAYFDLVLQNPGAAPLPDSPGALDGAGAATADFVLAPGLAPGAAGVTLHHAYAVFDAAGTVQFTSNAAPLTLVP